MPTLPSIPLPAQSCGFRSISFTATAGLFPTDGSGIFGLPVNPALGPGDLANLSLAQIRALYAGSAGGTGYDLAWAVDINNLPVNLASISQIRVEVFDHDLADAFFYAAHCVMIPQ